MRLTVHSEASAVMRTSLLSSSLTSYKQAFEGFDKSLRFKRICQDATSGYRKDN